MKTKVKIEFDQFAFHVFNFKTNKKAKGFENKDFLDVDYAAQQAEDYGYKVMTYKKYIVFFQINNEVKYKEFHSYDLEEWKKEFKYKILFVFTGHFNPVNV